LPQEQEPQSQGVKTTRELIKILRGIRELDVVGADIVEVAPAHDTLGGEMVFVAAALA
jgi:agmatinase